MAFTHWQNPATTAGSSVYAIGCIGRWYETGIFPDVIMWQESSSRIFDISGLNREVQQRARRAHPFWISFEAGQKCSYHGQVPTSEWKFYHGKALEPLWSDRWPLVDETYIKIRGHRTCLYRAVAR